MVFTQVMIVSIITNIIILIIVVRVDVTVVFNLRQRRQRGLQRLCHLASCATG